MEQHNKIINNAAKKILAPEGLFRIGSSRSWLDDNDYFLIIVEFQQSGFSKGSYLNVAVSFLWEKTKEMNECLGFDYGDRVLVNGKQFAEYRGAFKDKDEKFTANIEEFAIAALEKINEYRKFIDLDYAKKMLEEKSTSDNAMFWEVYDLAMLCFFKKDFDEGKKYFSDYLDILKQNFDIEWHKEFYNYCLKEIVPQLKSAETAQRMVFDMINRRRQFFNNKTSYKKMKKDIWF